MEKLFRGNFRYEPDEDDPINGLFSVRDIDSKFICNTKTEEVAQIVVEALDHWISADD